MFKTQYRFPAQNRLNHPSILFSQSFVLKFAQNQLPYSRFGFIISKKIAKKAVKRNRIKRVFRSCLEDLQPQITPGYDLLFILRMPAANKQKPELYEEITTQLKTKSLISLKQ